MSKIQRTPAFALGDTVYWLAMVACVQRSIVPPGTYCSVSETRALDATDAVVGVAPADVVAGLDWSTLRLVLEADDANTISDPMTVAWTVHLAVDTWALEDRTPAHEPFESCVGGAVAVGQGVTLTFASDDLAAVDPAEASSEAGPATTTSADVEAPFVLVAGPGDDQLWLGGRWVGQASATWNATWFPTCAEAPEWEIELPAEAWMPWSEPWVEITGTCGGATETWRHPAR